MKELDSAQLDDKTFERYMMAAQVIVRNGSLLDAEALIMRLWQSDGAPRRQEFRVFAALIECRLFSDPIRVLDFLNKLVTSGLELDEFWERRSMAEKAVVMDWIGQIHLFHGEKAEAVENFNRAASLGRDTSLLWRQLSELSAAKSELRLAVRYLQRSLDLYRQLDLKLLSGGDFMLGQFSGNHPLKSTHKYEDYLQSLLGITRVGKGQKNLKLVRELVVEMIHLFPKEMGLKKIRIMLESALVRHDLKFLRVSKNLAQ